MQQQLAQRAGLDVTVQAVWLERYEGDTRERWPGHVLTDRRVAHTWDKDPSIGAAFAHLTHPEDGGPEWDAWFLYDADARWSAPVPAPRAWGRTIVGSKDKLAAALDALPGADRLRTPDASATRSGTHPPVAAR